MAQATTLEKLVESNRLGLLCAAGEFIAGHPFDAVKTKVQASSTCSPQNSAPTASLNGRQTALLIWRSQGVSGFYAGGLANLSRLTAKALYRHPTRGYLKKWYSDLVPLSSGARRERINLATGLSMSLLDAAALTPMERAKVWYMTRPSIDSSFVNQLLHWRARGILRTEMFRGLCPSVMRSSVSWCSYLVFEEAIYDTLKRRRRSAEEQEDETLLEATGRLVLTGLCGGLVNTLLTLPLDNAKTQFQRHHQESTGRVSSRPVSTRGVLSSLYRARGVKALYAGWGVRLPHYVIVGIVQAQIIPKVDAVWGLRQDR